MRRKEDDLEGTQRRRKVGAVIAAVVMIAVSSTAFASAASRYKEQITAFRAELKTQAEADAGGLAADDLVKVADWLDQSEKLLNEGKTDQAGYRLKRAEYGLDLTRALVGASQIAGKADEQEKAYGDSQAQIEKLKKEIEQLQTRKAELQKEINTYR